MTAADPLVLEMAHRFAQDRLAPGAAAREKAAAIEPEIIAELGELGFLGATTSTAWDVSELDPVTYALALEEISAQGFGELLDFASVNRFHNRLSSWEVAIQGADADAGAARDFFKTHVEPEFRKPGLRGIDQQLSIPGTVGAGFARWSYWFSFGVDGLLLK